MLPRIHSSVEVNPCSPALCGSLKLSVLAASRLLPSGGSPAEHTQSVVKHVDLGCSNTHGSPEPKPKRCDSALEREKITHPHVASILHATAVNVLHRYALYPVDAAAAGLKVTGPRRLRRNHLQRQRLGLQSSRYAKPKEPRSSTLEDYGRREEEGTALKGLSPNRGTAVSMSQYEVLGRAAPQHCEVIRSFLAPWIRSIHRVLLSAVCRLPSPPCYHPYAHCRLQHSQHCARGLSFDNEIQTIERRSRGRWCSISSR